MLLYQKTDVDFFSSILAIRVFEGTIIVTMPQAESPQDRTDEPSSILEGLVYDCNIGG